MSDIIENFGFDPEDEEAIRPFANLADKYINPTYKEEMRQEVRGRAMFLALKRDLGDKRNPWIIMEEWEDIQTRDNQEVD